MASVLLDRLVDFVDDPVVSTLTHQGIVGEEEEEEGDFGVWKEVPNWEDEPSWEAISEGMGAYLQSMKPDPRTFAPPRVSYLSLVRPPVSGDSALHFKKELNSGLIAAADKGMLVLYAGPYRPGSSSEGCYLVYNACGNTLSTIPAIPYSKFYSSVGNGTVVDVAHENPEKFVLAELLRSATTTPPLFFLLLWSQETQRWVEKAVDPPTDVCTPTHIFCAHVSFSFHSNLCWVDLLHGLLTCNLKNYFSGGGHSEFNFIQLPPGHSINNTCHYNPEEFRSVSCVAGTIKYVTIDGYLQRGRSDDELKLTTWTLRLDGLSPRWDVETTLFIKDLWADETFLLLDLPKIKPMYPVLSTKEHDVVYLALADTKTVSGCLVKRIQHLLSINTRHNKVLSTTNYGGQGIFWPQLFASEFSVYLQAQRITSEEATFGDFDGRDV